MDQINVDEKATISFSGPIFLLMVAALEDTVKNKSVILFIVIRTHLAGAKLDSAIKEF